MFSIPIIFLALLSALNCLDVFDPAGCGKIKSCLRWSSCNLPTCDFGFTWRKIFYNSKDYLEIEIVGQMANNSNGFLALGFSTNNKMEDNGVVACRMNDDGFSISSGHNGVHYNMLFSSSDVDQDLLVSSKGTQYGVEFDSKHSVLRCRFLRLVTPRLKQSELKDLDFLSYFVLSAKGITNTPSALSYHSGNRRVSPSSYVLTSESRVNNIITNSYRMVKIHACFMIVGWILFATNGIFIAFFYKNNWPEKGFCGQKIWFQSHRLLQTSCVLCVVTGFIVIFVHVGRYSTLGSLPNTAHPVLGIIATSLLLVNPIMALIRCHPDSPSRWLFNRIHFIVGVSAYVLAMCAMAIGIQMPPAGPSLSNMFMPYIVVIAFIVAITFLFCAEIVRNWYQSRKKGVQSTIQLIWSSNINESRENLVPNTTTEKARYNIIIDSVLTSVIITVVLIVLVLIY